MSIFSLLSKKKPPLEGVSNELNAIASMNLDSADTRRRVRAAFIEVYQKLDHCLFKIPHARIRTEEWYERNSRGMEIFCKSWMPEPSVPIKATFYYCHGYADTCTFFFEGVARRIAAAGYAVYAMDYPGFGLSDGLHGYIPNIDDFVEDVIEQYTKIKARPEVSGLPRFIMGHSFGGTFTLKVYLKEPNNWDGVIVNAPVCKIADEPSSAVLEAYNLLSKVMPKAKLLPKIDSSHLIYREPSKRKVVDYNVVHYNDNPRLKTGMEMRRAAKEIGSLIKGSFPVSAPLLVLHGGEDKVVAPLVGQLIYENASSKDKTIKIYEGGYHCILEGEPDDITFATLDDIVSWLDSRCSIK